MRKFGTLAIVATGALLTVACNKPADTTNTEMTVNTVETNAMATDTGAMAGNALSTGGAMSAGNSMDAGNGMNATDNAMAGNAMMAGNSMNATDKH